jgi:hypothetical protein
VTVAPSFAKITANFSGVGGYFFESLFDPSDTVCPFFMPLEKQIPRNFCRDFLCTSDDHKSIAYLHKKQTAKAVRS